MSHDQQAARVNVSDDDWIAFRTVAMRERRSIADYLGDLVRRELASPAGTPGDPAPKERKPARRESSARVLLADQELLTSLPGSRPQPPPWEE